ncbi:mandelate racemase/muconate lactonizing enzyme family protein [Aquimarina gracilis]|uniref:glucarate dehydratase n=1 Tax=Aquimarina gracilis TaxID=874422 RepID=A0ABU5ZRF2_9FLAO|nr:mandelate racemase/muconate lactonizing enzyme family protein [Aquimarina gracilis]MEB3344376.1 mandelate racemase/muconate lactonizing enzyme family protein [Aquimarina gracilis]
MLDRRKFLKKTATVGAAAATLPIMACAENPKEKAATSEQIKTNGLYVPKNIEEEISSRVKNKLTSPVIIDKIEVVVARKRYFTRITDKEGNQGVAAMNSGRFKSTETIFKKLAAANFIGKDAREVAHLPNDILKVERNYKFVGLPYWNAIGTIEIAIWDLLGKLTNKPVHHYLGKQIRTEYPVYISSLEREKPFEGETERIQKTVEITGATATKIKIGGRMKNIEPFITRTNQFVPHVRKTFGDDFTIYVDGNSSYTANEAIEVLKMLESYDVKFFEEPCYWQDLWSHKLVKGASTTCAIAGGEQDSSFDQFKLMCEIKAMDILQPDVYYHGGIVRTLKISHMAAHYGVGFTPHSPKAGPMAAAPNQVFAVCPVLTAHQEYRVGGEEKQKSWHTPVLPKNGNISIFTAPGLGIEYANDLWKEEKIYWTSNDA